eukprot:GSMAST32.ASY1.ANO1.2696.1 assembled CDS
MSAMDDEVQRKLQKPKDISKDEVMKLAKSLYGFDVNSVCSLDSYDDLNFYIKEAQGNEYVFKVHNGVESADPEFLDAMDRLFMFISGCGISTPIPIISVDGKTKCTLQKTYNNIVVKHSIRVLSWLSGTQLGKTPVSPSLFKDSGCCLGKLRNRLDEFSRLGEKDINPFKRVHSWDLRQTREVRKFCHCLKDENRLQLVLSVFDKFDKVVIPLAESGDLRLGILQGDWNDANIIVQQKQTNVEEKSQNKYFVSGIIDFGDCVWSWLVNELAIALAYVGVTTVTENISCHAMKAFLSGFFEQYSLNESELKVLPTLVACRIAMSCVMGCYSSSKDPDNAYINLHAAPAWIILQALCSNKLHSVFSELMTTMGYPCPDKKNI